MGAPFSVAALNSGLWAFQSHSAPKSQTSAGQQTHQAAPAGQYDETSRFRPSEVGEARGGGGYSSSASGASYDLLLRYAENLEPASSRRPSRNAGQPSELPNSSHWSEDRYYDEGSQALLRGQPQRALLVFTRGVRDYPASAKLQVGLAVSLYARGDYAAAVRILIRTTDLVPSDPQPYLFLARVERLAGRHDSGVTTRLKRLIEIAPASPQAHYEYALALERTSAEPRTRAKLIESELKRSCWLDPRWAEPHLRLGALYGEEGNSAQAIREYGLAAAIEPDLPEVHYRLAQAYLRSGERAKAQAELAEYERLKAVRRPWQ